MTTLHPTLAYSLVFLASLAISLFSIPNIIYVAKRKRLLDIPDNARKLHKRIVPNLGGVGIFFAFIIATSLFINPAYPSFREWNYIIAATLILFITGIKDDLVQISPSKKLVAQLAAAIIIVCFADIRIKSLDGFLGIYEMPIWISMAFSVIGCVFVTNAFNLIDGIDGLAGSIGILICLMFGGLHAINGNVNSAIIAFSLTGAIVGFLKSNLSPAKIFMGDTGSLIIGFAVAAVAILFIKSFNASAPVMGIIKTPGGYLLIAIAVLFIPVFDTFRVFTMRLIKGRSPFSADRTHLHHYLLDLGLGHSQAVATIVSANLFIIVLAILLQPFGINWGIAGLIVAGFGLIGLLFLSRKTSSKRIERLVVLEKQNLLKGKTDVEVIETEINEIPTQRTTLVVNGKRIIVSETEEYAYK